MDWSESFQLPGGGTVELRPVSESDNEFLVSVYASTRADELAQVEWNEGQKEMFIRWQFRLQRREYATRWADAHYRVIVFDQQPAGPVWVLSIICQLRHLDLSILPEH